MRATRATSIEARHHKPPSPSPTALLALIPQEASVAVTKEMKAEIKRLARAGGFDEIEARFGAKWLHKARGLVAKDAAKAAGGGDGAGGGVGADDDEGDGAAGMPPPPPKSAVKAPLAAAAGAETGPKGAPPADGASLAAQASPGASKVLLFAAKVSNGRWGRGVGRGRWEGARRLSARVERLSSSFSPARPDACPLPPHAACRWTSSTRRKTSRPAPTPTRR